MDVLLAVAVALTMAVGLVGTIVPVLPGLLLVWAAALAFGLVDGFGTTGTVAMVVITAVAVLGTVAGVVLPGRAAGAAGASSTSIRLGIDGAVAGFFLVPVVGLPLGGALGIFVGERARTGDTTAAWRATVATLAGFGVGALAELTAGVAMATTWAVWLVAG